MVGNTMSLSSLMCTEEGERGSGPELGFGQEERWPGEEENRPS